MSPAELIGMMFFGSLLIFFLAVVWFIFRKRKKIALILTIISVLTFILFFALRPYYVKQQHAERYTILSDYLHDQYPHYEFNISPKVLEDGYRPYEYQVIADGYKYRHEFYRVDDDGSVMFTSYSTTNWGNEEDLDNLVLNSVYEKPFEYLERNVELEEIARHNEEGFLLRLMRVDGKTILYNYLIIDGQYFLEQSNHSNENNYIELNVSSKHDENYYVLATLPGFDVEHWKKVNEIAADIEFKGELPAIYVVPN